MKVHEELFLSIVVSVLGNTAWTAEPIRIVVDGRPRAVVVLPAEADGQTEAAARVLVEYVRQSSGAGLTIVKGPLPEPSTQPVAIHVGRSQLVDRLHPQWELRIGDFRVFYDDDVEESLVKIEAIGYKEGSKLFVHGEEYEL